MEPTFANLLKRATETALERIPSQPVDESTEAWQEYMGQLEAFEDHSDIAHEEADSWDWVIYNHAAMKLCSNVSSSILDAAEEQANDCGGIDEAFKTNGLYGVATLCAYWIVYQEVYDALEEVRQTQLDVAYNKLNALEVAA